MQGPSGSSAHLRQLYRALQQHSRCRLFSVTRADRRGWYGLPTEATIGGAVGWPSWLRRHRYLREVRSARRLQAQIEGWRPELLLERHSLFSDVGWRASHSLSIPWALEVNAPLALERSRYEELLRPAVAQRWEAEVLQAAPIKFTVSRWLRDWLQDELGCTGVHWLPNGTAAARGDGQRGRRLLGIPPGRQIIGFVGSGRPWQCQDTLDALATLDAEVVVVGGKRWFNPQSLADVIAAFDVAVAPYTEDSPQWFCPLKLLAYRAQGVPIVASDVGDVAEFIGAGELIPPGMTSCFVEAVSVALADASRPAPWIRSWDDVARELLNVLVPFQRKSG